MSGGAWARRLLIFSLCCPACTLPTTVHPTTGRQHCKVGRDDLNGKWMNEWTCLQVEKSNKKRDVKTAVVKRGREVCRAYRNGQCLGSCRPSDEIK